MSLRQDCYYPLPRKHDVGLTAKDAIDTQLSTQPRFDAQQFSPFIQAPRHSHVRLVDTSALLRCAMYGCSPSKRISSFFFQMTPFLVLMCMSPLVMLVAMLDTLHSPNLCKLHLQVVCTYYTSLSYASTTDGKAGKGSSYSTSLPPPFIE